MVFYLNLGYNIFIVLPGVLFLDSAICTQNSDTRSFSTAVEFAHSWTPTVFTCHD